VAACRRRVASLRSGGDSACGAEGGGLPMGPQSGPGSEGSEGSACLWQAGSEGGGLPLCGNAYKISVTGLPFCVIRYDRHSGDWLAALASPFPATPDFPPIQGAE